MKKLSHLATASMVLAATCSVASLAQAQTAPPAAPAPEAAAPPTSPPDAAQAPTQPAAAPPAVTPSAAPAGVITISPPPPGKGQVVFFRKSSMVGMAVVYKVREGDKAYGTLSSGKYFVVVADPGPHTYVVHSEAKDELRLEVDDGETYYVEGTVAMGVVVGRPNISPSTEVAFQSAAKKLKLAAPEPETTSASH